MSALCIEGGRCLLPGPGLAEDTLHVSDGRIAKAAAAGARRLDARGLLVLPGIVDLHGDAHERQLQPRPGVGFAAPLALADTEAQLLACGVTTAFLAVTLSWEPGLRGGESWTALRRALAARAAEAADGGAGGCDLRVHLRWEAFNLDATEAALEAIAAGAVHLLAFNDHTPAILRRLDAPAAVAKYVERAGVSATDFCALARRMAARGAEVPGAQARLAAAARAAGLPMASHDDDTVAGRDAFRALGAGICDFPMNGAVAAAATAAGDRVVMGAPNVLRGGSHLGWGSAAAAIAAGHCDVLVSDYFYPALLQAPFRLAAAGMPLPEAWALVSANPARAGGLADRGTLATGARADVLLVRPGDTARVVAVVTEGRIAHLTAEGAERLR